MQIAFSVQAAFASSQGVGWYVLCSEVSLFGFSTSKGAFFFMKSDLMKFLLFFFHFFPPIQPLSEDKHS